MRLLLKLVMKFVTMVVMVLVMASVLRYGSGYVMKAAGMSEGPQFSSEESDLMTTIFKSAFKLFTGSAKRNELASELSDKLYSGRADAGTMSELGIELVKPGEDPAAPKTGAAKLPPGTNAPAAPGSPNAAPGATAPNTQPGIAAANPLAALLPGQSPALPKVPSAKELVGDSRMAVLNRIWDRMKVYSVEMVLIPVVILGMMLVGRIRRRRNPEDGLMPAFAGVQGPAETEPYDMKHAVNSLSAEEFELLVAVIYQRQGYRVSMPDALSGGRGGDFTLARKSEKILVQCKRLNSDHRVPVERVKELHEAMTTAGVKRGLYVVSCGFTWDARNFAKTRGLTLISGRTLDELLTAAKETPGENLLDVSAWAPKLMGKVTLTAPTCPACEAAMDQVNASTGSVWVCSQRPDCRGRRPARKHRKAVIITTPRPADLEAVHGVSA